jgi:sugar phosphate isomerase/epimerase
VGRPPLPDLGLGCWTIGDVDFATLVDAAEAHGFRSLSVSPYIFEQALVAGWTETAMRACLAAAGITVSMVDALTEVFPNVTPSSELDPAERAVLGAAASDAPGRAVGIRAATALGAHSVNVTHYRGRPTPLDELADALARVAAEVALVCVEFVPGNSIPDLETAQRVVEMSGAPNARVLYDTFHHARNGGTVDDLRALPANSLGAIQLSDRIAPELRAPGSSFKGRSFPGEGSLPLVELVATALENSPDLTIDLEVINTDLAAMTADEIVAASARAAASWRADYEAG